MRFVQCGRAQIGEQLILLNRIGKAFGGRGCVGLHPEEEGGKSTRTEGWGGNAPRAPWRERASCVLRMMKVLEESPKFSPVLAYPL